MNKFKGTKEVMAKPMTLGEYNTLRGWVLPENEYPATDGYLVEYLDSPNKNHDDYDNYISWSPKDVFERYYNSVDTFLERLVLEEKEIGEKIVALNNGLMSNGFSEKVGMTQFELLALQHSTMMSYRRVLIMRINDLKSKS
jgi:hypothetical protein